MTDTGNIVDLGARETNFELATKVEKLEDSVETLYIAVALCAVGLYIVSRWFAGFEERLVKLESLR